MTDVPSRPIEWVGVDIKRPSRFRVVTKRLWFDARDEVTRQLGAPKERVRIVAVCEGESVEAAGERLRKLVEAEAKQVAARAPAAASAKVGGARERGVRS